MIAQCKHNCKNCAGYETTGECNHGCFDCIHFDGGNCINCCSNYYGCEGNVCGGDCHTWTQNIGSDNMNKDEIKFWKNLGTYENLVKYDLDVVGPEAETNDITMNSIITIEKIAQKYHLYGNEWEKDVDYVNNYIIPRLKEFFDKGDDIMKPISDINNANIEELKKIDIEKIKKHFKQNGFDNWIFDHDLQKWFNMSTNQTIREYLLDNVEMTLSPDILKEYVSELIWHENFDQIISEELTDMQLLSTVISKERTEKGYIVYLIGEKITITPKQWRMIVYEATKRFIRRE